MTTTPTTELTDSDRISRVEGALGQINERLGEMQTTSAAHRAEAREDNAALRAEARADNAALRAEAREDNAALRAEVRADMQTMHAAMEKMQEAHSADMKAVHAAIEKMQEAHSADMKAMDKSLREEIRSSRNHLFTAIGFTWASLVAAIIAIFTMM